MFDEKEIFTGVIEVHGKEIEFETYFPKNWKWTCLRCGFCCRFKKIEVFEEEKEIVSKYNFLEETEERDGKKRYFIKQRAEKCSFLINYNVCKIYENRPSICRRFPFSIRRDLFSGKLKIILNLSCPAINHPKSNSIEREFLEDFAKRAYETLSKKFKIIREPFPIERWIENFSEYITFVTPDEIFFTIKEIKRRAFEEEDFLFSFRKRIWAYEVYYNQYLGPITSREDSTFIIDASEDLFQLFKDEFHVEKDFYSFLEKTSYLSGTEGLYPYRIKYSDNKLIVNYFGKKKDKKVSINKNILAKKISDEAKSTMEFYVNYLIDHPIFQYHLIQSLPIPCIVGLFNTGRILHTLYIISIICSLKNNHEIIERNDVEESIRILDQNIMEMLWETEDKKTYKF
ncbi:MAG: YkgJ family cysteine cluster protein [Candidatus Hydrothermarchaeota archaeon]